MVLSDRLTERQHAHLSRWWDEQDRRVIQQAYIAAGFTVIFSCLGWTEMRRTLPDMAEVLGRSIIARYRMRI